jgi:hypothetical protein
MLAAGPAAAGQDGDEKKRPTDAEIRSGLIIDDGLDIPHIRPGTQYFEIHGSTRIARALGESRLPTDDAGLSTADALELSDPEEPPAW